MPVPLTRETVLALLHSLDPHVAGEVIDALARLLTRRAFRLPYARCPGAPGPLADSMACNIRPKHLIY
jgi:hypothetical protein